MTNLANNLVAAIVFAALGIVTFIVAFIVVDRLTPYDLWKEIIEDQNSALAILIGFVGTRPRADYCVGNSLGRSVQGAACRVHAVRRTSHCRTGLRLLGMAPALLVSVLLIASCGLVYELIAGTLASYLLGDSVTQFSTVIGSYLAAMGVGSWLSRYIGRGLATRFVIVELLVGLVGGFSSTILFAAFAYTSAFRLVLYVVVVIVGVLVGLEIPLLMRILKDRFNFKDVVAHVLTFDYLGALGASLLFPLVLVPHLGLVRSALLFGLINAGVALWTTELLKSTLRARGFLQASAVGVIVALGAGSIWSDRILEIGETNLYADDVVLAKTTPYQRIVLTAWKDDLRLFLNSHLQFSSKDEYRYHEALVHPGLSAQPNARRVLVLGGGDGLAVREILKHPGPRDDHARRSRPGDDAPVLDPPRAATAQSRRIPRSPRARRERRRVRVARSVAEPSSTTSRWWTSRIRRSYSIGKLYTTAFYAALGVTSYPRAASSSRARRRCSRASRSGVWCRRSKPPG